MWILKKSFIISVVLICLVQCTNVANRFWDFSTLDEIVFSHFFFDDETELFFVAENTHQFIRNAAGNPPDTTEILDQDDGPSLWFFRNGTLSLDTYVIYSSSFKTLLENRINFLDEIVKNICQERTSFQKAERYKQFLEIINTHFKESGFLLRSSDVERNYWLILSDRRYYVFFSLAKPMKTEKLVFGALSADFQSMKTRRRSELPLKTFFLIPDKIQDTPLYPNPILRVRPYDSTLALKRLEKSDWIGRLKGVYDFDTYYSKKEPCNSKD